MNLCQESCFILFCSVCITSQVGTEKKQPPEAKYPIEIVCPSSAQLTVEGKRIETHICDRARLCVTTKGWVSIFASCRWHPCRLFIQDPLIVRRFYDAEDYEKKETPKRPQASSRPAGTS